MFITGFNKTFDFKKLNWCKRVMYTITTPIWVRYWEVSEAIAVLWALITPITEFQIVKKEF